MKSIIIL